MKKKSSILLTGGSGQLGQAVQRSNLFPNLLAPPKQELDLADFKNVRGYFNAHKISTVIHCAALARISLCETDPIKAIDTNVIGTANLVKAVSQQQKAAGHEIRFLHMSTDGVYPGLKGKYKENGPTVPYNNYGWTKLASECLVRLLADHCIIRTNFFDPDHIKFGTSATDIFTSKLSLEDLVKSIKFLLNHRFVGAVNVGGERLSDYRRYKQYKPQMKSCTRKEILKTIPFQIYSDASLDTTLWRKLKRQGSVR